MCFKTSNLKYVKLLGGIEKKIFNISILKIFNKKNIFDLFKHVNFLKYADTSARILFFWHTLDISYHSSRWVLGKVDAFDTTNLKAEMIFLKYFETGASSKIVRDLIFIHFIQKCIYKKVEKSFRKIKIVFNKIENLVNEWIFLLDLRQNNCLK